LVENPTKFSLQLSGNLDQIEEFGKISVHFDFLFIEQFVKNDKLFNEKSEMKKKDDEIQEFKTFIQKRQ
jgi:hypothetical protein